MAIIVSMPFIGLLPFLRVDKMILYKNVDESMPFIGLLPFLLLQIQPNDSKGDESMPFIGLLPFLHKVSRLKAPEIRLSQCPLSGFFHFYYGKRINFKMQQVESMPFIGLLPFLRSPLGTP